MQIDLIQAVMIIALMGYLLYNTLSTYYKAPTKLEKKKIYGQTVALTSVAIVIIIAVIGLLVYSTYNSSL